MRIRMMAVGLAVAGLLVVGVGAAHAATVSQNDVGCSWADDTGCSFVLTTAGTYQLQLVSETPLALTTVTVGGTTPSCTGVSTIVGNTAVNQETCTVSTTGRATVTVHAPAGSSGTIDNLGVTTTLCLPPCTATSPASGTRGT